MSRYFAQIKILNSIGFFSLMQCAISVKPNDASAWINLGIAIKDSANTTEAIEAFQKEITALAGDTRMWINLGIALNDSGEAKGAFEAYCNALIINPNDLSAWNNLQRAFEDSGDLHWVETILEESRSMLKNKGVYGDLCQIRDRYYSTVLRALKNRSKRGDGEAEKILAYEIAKYIKDPILSNALGGIRMALWIDRNNSFSGLSR